MKTTRIIASLAVGAALVLATGKTQAQVLQKLNLSGTMTYQGADQLKANNGSVTTNFTTKKVSFNNNKIITFLNASAAFTNAAGGLIPKSSYFVMNDVLDIIVTNKSGFNYNLTAGTFAAVDPGTLQVFTGNANNMSTQFKQNGLSVTGSFDINDGAGNDILFSGLVKFNINDGKANNKGEFNESRSSNIAGVGAGSVVATLNGASATLPAVTEGKANSSGNGKLTVPPAL
jgi:hypothetical protein